MHKSHLILLEKRDPIKATDNNREAESTTVHGNHLLGCHKTMVQMAKNSLKKIRESLLMSKSELAREANVSPITITRIEEGKPCRLETKRKILLALGYSLSDSKKIFGE